MLKVLYCGLKYDYGNQARGLAFEYKTLFGVLSNMPGVEASFFSIDENMQKFGRDEMNKKLIEEVQKVKPDLLFCVLFTEEIKKETIKHITFELGVKTFNWFGDDHWRVPIFSRFWAPLFSLVATTDTQAMEHYKSYGSANVIKSQWAANPNLYKHQNLQLDQRKYNITFFGQRYGIRPKYIDYLKSHGLPAEGIGRGWGNGSGSDVQEMLNIYSFSKINLNFSETPYYGFKSKINLFSKLIIRKELGKIKFVGHKFFDNLKSLIGTQRRTVKGRVFEVPACGGFLLTGRSDEDMNQYYVPGKEVVVFENKADLLEKCKYYLSHEAERKAIAQAGYARTLKDHTYEQRFKEIFKRLELVLD